MEPLGFNLGIGLIQFIVVGVTVGLPVISVIDLARKKTDGYSAGAMGSDHLRHPGAGFRRLLDRQTCCRG